ncbi:uncharacterized protein LOC129582962 isoform X2 [Paramacrobiotus metropolitanus]|uniref:uncharacterized protein LOC129582962 isoform X2 n=1 Tax=Paramacrobiotus metropolitanus TaxID=2943436 RepID=UPI0024456B4E|nr:uncharacterized protein LOC129582962 isoform X2 [Paramacrobiotus metropolitanus]
MGVEKPFTFSVDKELFSSYPEILTESVLALWFACEICLRFGLRVLPEWRTSRVDPDRRTDLDTLLELSGLRSTAGASGMVVCFADYNYLRPIRGVSLLYQCILFATILAVYCIGRIVGLWMNDTYLVLIQKGFRKLIAAKSTAETLSSDSRLENASVAFVKRPGLDHVEKAVCSFLIFLVRCIVVHDHVWSLCQYFPIVEYWQSSINIPFVTHGLSNTRDNGGGNTAGTGSTGGSTGGNTGGTKWMYWTTVNVTDACSKDGTRLFQRTAMLSDWDLQSQELLAMHTSKAKLLASFAPFFSPVVGWMFLMWCAVLSIAGGVYYVIFGLVVLFLGGMLVHEAARLCYDPWRGCVIAQRSGKAGDRDQSQLLTGEFAAVETGIVDSAPVNSLSILSDKALDGACTAPPANSQEDGTPNQVIQVEPAPQVLSYAHPRHPNQQMPRSQIASAYVRWCSATLGCSH